MRKNTWKKALCLGLAAVLLASTATAAPKKKSKKKSDPYAKVEKHKDPKTKKVYNFKGMSVTIGDWWTNPDAPLASKQQEDTKAFRDWMSETYNMSCIQKAVSGWDSNPQFVTNYCITGGDEYYVFIIDGRTANVGVRANLFYDLSKIKSVNYKDATKYDQGVVEKLAKGSSFYAFNTGKPEPKNGMYFNKRLLSEVGYDPDLPYDLQQSGEWTWAKFEEMCKKLTRDTDNDGVTDVYAMSSFNTEFTYAAITSNGGTLISRDANGKYYNNVNSEETMEALNWTAEMFRNYQLPQAEGANWDYFYTAFMNGETAFLADQQYNGNPGGRFGDMKDDWGFVCFPLGPSGDGVYKTLHDSNMCVIPSCYSADEIEKIAKIVDLYYEPVPGYEDEDSWKEYFYPGYRDSRAVDETLELMAATPNPRFDTLISGLSAGELIWGICGGWQTPQEAYEATAPVWQGLIDDCNR